MTKPIDGAEARVLTTLSALRDRLRDRPQTRKEYTGPVDDWGRPYRLVPSRWALQTERAERRLLGQIAAIRPSLDYFDRRDPNHWRPVCCEPLDIWPGRGPRPRVSLPVLRQLDHGWYRTQVGAAS